MDGQTSQKREENQSTGQKRGASVLVPPHRILF
jgi:hypothetical protein